MPKVAIVAANTSQFVKDDSRPVFEFATDPCVELLESNFSSLEIDSVLLSTCANEQYSATILAEILGIRPRLSQRIDNLCNSGTNALVTGYSLIASGLSECVLVVGAEKRESPGSHLTWDASRGAFSLPVHWAALFARAHMRKFGTTEEQLAAVAAKNRSTALKNPKALFKRMISVNDVMQSKKIVEPLKLLDCSAPCCGASAVIMVSERKAKSCDKPVWIKGIGQQTNSASFANSTSDLTRIDAASIASREAFKMARTRPSQIDIAEVHDAFSIIEILAMEDIGFVKKGEGGLHVGKTHQVINPRGGILGSGHPVGATGVAQTAEIVNQLQGKAGLSQVTGCKMGLVHNLAAAGSSATVLILGADQ